MTGMANSMTNQFANSPLLDPATKDQALANAAGSGLSLFGYDNTNPAPHNHGHVGSFSVGENVSKGEVANIGAHNGFLPVGPGPGAVFSHQTVSIPFLKQFLVKKFSDLRFFCSILPGSGFPKIHGVVSGYILPSIR
jgi:hypothetical protein